MRRQRHASEPRTSKESSIINKLRPAAAFLPPPPPPPPSATFFPPSAGTRVPLVNVHDVNKSPWPTKETPKESTGGSLYFFNQFQYRANKSNKSSNVHGLNCRYLSRVLIVSFFITHQLNMTVNLGTVVHFYSCRNSGLWDR